MGEEINKANVLDRLNLKKEFGIESEELALTAQHLYFDKTFMMKLTLDQLESVLENGNLISNENDLFDFIMEACSSNESYIPLLSSTSSSFREANLLACRSIALQKTS